MSAIARVLLQLGYTVSGSDLRANAFTRDLAASGAVIVQGHAAANVAGADVVITTSAAPGDNPELVAARAAGIPVLRRRDLLGQLMADKTGIAIAGTHGKTTTTALLTHVLIEARRDPTYIVGGVMADTGTNAGVGQGDEFVIEADEYDRMFLGLRPQIAVVTNVEHDHPDCYPTLADMLDAFRAFVDRLPDDGLLVACADDPLARDLADSRRAAGRPVVTYAAGVHPADWQAINTQPDAAGGAVGGSLFDVRHGDRLMQRVRLAQPGHHNVQNALAVIAVADRLGIAFEVTAAALRSFRGTGRRAEVMGQAGGVTVINDYAHHPTAIRVTLRGLRDRPDLRGLWAVWQPHTYGRMRALADDFAQAFGAADHVLVTDVYSVRETVTPGLDAGGMSDLIGAVAHGAAGDVRYTGSLDATVQALAGSVQPGDVVVLLSAGDAPQVGERLLDILRAREHPSPREEN